MSQSIKCPKSHIQNSEPTTGSIGISLPSESEQLSAESLIDRIGKFKVKVDKQFKQKLTMKGKTRCLICRLARCEYDEQLPMGSYYQKVKRKQEEVQC